MGLFDKKATVPPGVAECEAHIAELEQQRKNVVFRIGSKYVELNSFKDAEGTLYEEDMKELETIAQNLVIAEKRKLSLIGEKQGHKRKCFLKNPKKFFEGFFKAAQAAKRRAWGGNPSKIPAGQNERSREFWYCGRILL